MPRESKFQSHKIEYFIFNRDARASILSFYDSINVRVYRKLECLIHHNNKMKIFYGSQIFHSEQLSLSVYITN
jgi:hypothetical protein